MKLGTAAHVDAARQVWMDARERVGRVNEAAVFVVGNQKSGTSAIGSLLAIYGGLRATIDIIPEIRRQLVPEVAAGRTSFAKVVRTYRRSFSRDLVKHPNFVLILDQLIAAFPQGRFAFIVRDPRDNIRSILDRVDLPGNSSELTPSEISALSPAWRRVFDIGETDASNYVASLCQRWNSAVDSYQRHKERMALIRYEDFVKDKVVQIALLAGVLGIEERCTIHQLVDKPFQPAGANRLQPLSEFFGTANLKTIELLCGSRASSLGYRL